MSIKTKIEKLLCQRILVLDGAMGTMIQQYLPDEAAYRGNDCSDSHIPLQRCNDLLCITTPHIISTIHEAYLDAGADIIKTNTFNANAILLANYGLQECVYVINFAGAQLARRVADSYMAQNPLKPRFVAGTIGPIGEIYAVQSQDSAADRLNTTFNEYTNAYSKQIEALIDGGVDILLIETILDLCNAQSALHAAKNIMQQRGIALPIMLSVTLSQSGCLLSGESLASFLSWVDQAPILSVGINCSYGAAHILPYLHTLAHRSSHYISLHPGAGLPNNTGGYDDAPADMIATLQPALTEGLVNIVGGCCGTTPEYIALLSQAVKGKSPHKPTYHA